VRVGVTAAMARTEQAVSSCAVLALASLGVFAHEGVCGELGADADLRLARVMQMAVTVRAST
jgi:hypothetical protein